MANEEGEPEAAEVPEDEECGANDSRRKLLSKHWQRFVESESYSSWQHFMTRGHSGKVLCVDCSDATDYIVSGGEDYSMRVWCCMDENFKEGQESAYDLSAILWHDDEREMDRKRDEDMGVAEDAEAPWCSLNCFSSSKGDEQDSEIRGVTAVICVGKRGPFISGTNRGDVFVLFLGLDGQEGFVMPQDDLHTNRINEICAPSGLGDLGEHDDWMVAIASEDGTASILRCRDGESEVVTLEHHLPVRGVQHIDSGGQADASFATHTVLAVHIWNHAGECLMKLGESSPSSGIESNAAVIDLGHDEAWITDIAVTNKDDGTLLFVGNKQSLRVWGFRRGRLCGQYGETPPPKPFNKQPLVTYRDTARSLDIDQSRTSTEFLVDLQDDYTCAVWNLKGIEKGDLAIEPRGPANYLAAPRRKRMLLDLKHSSKVTQIHVGEDPDDAGGPCLVSACNDGSVLLWDLEGVDAGEIYAELRSLHWTEIVLPLVLLMVSFFQVMSFAFGPDIKWRHEVAKPSIIAQKIAFGEIDYMVDVPRDLVFKPIVAVVIGAIIMFLVCALTGLPEILSYSIHAVQSTWAFKKEGRRSVFGLMHQLKRMCNLTRMAVSLMMLFCSTILVAPMFKILTQAVHCVPDPADAGPDPKYILANAPQIVCNEGYQLKLAIAVYVLSPLYYLVLMPYAIVEGNVGYMKWKKLFFPLYYWESSALRKATVLHLGPLHPNPKHIFITLILELTAKALLPIIEIKTAQHPRSQVLLITTVGLIMYVSSLIWPPKLGRMFLSLVQGTRLFTLCAMVCGCMTVFLEQGSKYPMITLGICSVLVPIHTIYRITGSDVNPPSVQTWNTSTILEAARDEGHQSNAVESNFFSNWTNALTGKTKESLDSEKPEAVVASGSIPKHRANHRIRGLMKKFSVKSFF